MDFDQLVAAVKQWIASAGLAPEDALRQIAEGVLREPVGFLRGRRDDPILACLTDACSTRRLTSEAAGVRFTDEDRALITKCGADPVKVRAAVVKLREERAAVKCTRITNEETADLRARGFDPAFLARMRDCHSPADYLRLKAEIGGAS